MASSKNRPAFRITSALLFIGVAFVIALIFFVPGILDNGEQQTVQQVEPPVPDEPESEHIANSEKLAYYIHSKHLAAPDYDQVWSHTNSVQALNAYLKTLDIYSRYLPPEEAGFLRRGNKKGKVGLGLDILMKADKILVVPIQQGPAYKAGMTSAAYVDSINDRKIAFDDFSSYAFLTQLEKGETVVVDLKAHENLSTTRFTIEAGEYENEPISVTPLGNVLYIHLRKFKAGVTRQLSKVLKTASQYETLVFDLRHCPGGDLYAMGDVLSLLLPVDLEVASIVKANGRKELTLKTLPGRMLSDQHLFVLVSEFTASTAELFTWALRDHYSAIKLLGEPTQGKCLAQEIFKFDDGSALKLTTYEVKTSSNQTCQDSPLVPDVAIPDIALADIATLHDVLTRIDRRDSDR